MEAEIVVERVQQVKLSTVQAYADDLRNLLSEAEATERKVFLKSFVKRVVVLTFSPKTVQDKVLVNLAK